MYEYADSLETVLAILRQGHRVHCLFDLAHKICGIMNFGARNRIRISDSIGSMFTYILNIARK